MRDMKHVAMLLEVVVQKHKLNKQQLAEDPIKNWWFQEYMKSGHYYWAIKSEVEEALWEDIWDNKIYLEDELCDILWDYLNLIYFLEQEDKIISIESLLERSYRKFDERSQALEKWISWDDIKKVQKKKLLQEHENMYKK